jgi:3',5'-cyclic AMP phosphodiesterase CpdA
LSWLDGVLAAQPTRPTIVALHHPPFATGIAHMDAMGLIGIEAFADILQAHPQIVRVLAGHVHRPVQAVVGGRLAMTAPSPAHQVVLDLTDDGPSRFIIEPPGYLVHRWRPETGLISHTAVIGDFGDRYPFFEDGALID